MSAVPDDLGWSEEQGHQGYDITIRRSRTASAVFLCVALGIEAWGLSNAAAILATTDALDQAYRPRPTYRSWDGGPLAALPFLVAFVCFVIIWRAIGRLRDTPSMRVDRSGFSLMGSRMMPYRPAIRATLAQILKFDPKPAGFSTDVIPLGGGWDVVLITHGGPKQRMWLPLDDLAQAQAVASRLNHLVGEAKRGAG